MSLKRTYIPEHEIYFNSLFEKLDQADIEKIAITVQKSAFQMGIWIEEQGCCKPIALTLRPRLLDLSSRGYIHHATWQIRLGMRRLARITLEDPDVAKILPLSDIEKEWIQKYFKKETKKGAGERVFCRLDALIQPHAEESKDFLKIMEPNVVGIGGMTYSPLAENVILENVFPALNQLDEEYTLEPNFDPRILLVDDLRDHAQTLGLAKTFSIGFVDDKALYSFGGEFGRLVPYLQSQGIEGYYLSPGELELNKDGELYGQGKKIDLIYRFLEINELEDLGQKGLDLTPIKHAFKKGIVVPSAGGDLEHKSAFEIFTRPDLSHWFSKAQQDVFKDHILWTRLLFERKTTGLENEEIDLFEFVHKNKDLLVIKPNREYGGQGIILGPHVKSSIWDQNLEMAHKNPSTHIVQLYCEPDVEKFPVLNHKNQLDFEQFYCTAGFFPGKRGLSAFGRFSKSKIVNIHLGGGIAPFLVNVS